MDKYAIFLDFDGTLSLENKISEENCKTLKKVQDAGNYVFICTGRNHQGIEPIASKIHHFDGYVSGLGSHITLDSEVIYEKYFSLDVVECIIEKFIDTGLIFSFGCVDQSYAINPTEYYKKYFEEIPSISYFRENCKAKEFQKIESPNVVWTTEQMNILESISTVYVHEGYTECCPKGCSKSAAIKIVSEKLSIKPENTIAMGDSANDLDMIMTAGIGVVMDNAPDFMKEKADFVTKSCRDHGVSYALEELILNKKA